MYYTLSSDKILLLDNTDFPAGEKITVPNTHDFRVGDPVVFTEEGTANLDTKITDGNQYYVVATTDTSIPVSDTLAALLSLLTVMARAW